MIMDIGQLLLPTDIQNIRLQIAVMRQGCWSWSGCFSSSLIYISTLCKRVQNQEKMVEI